MMVRWIALLALGGVGLVALPVAAQAACSVEAMRGMLTRQAQAMGSTYEVCAFLDSRGRRNDAVRHCLASHRIGDVPRFEPLGIGANLGGAYLRGAAMTRDRLMAAADPMGMARRIQRGNDAIFRQVDGDIDRFLTCLEEGRLARETPGQP